MFIGDVVRVDCTVPRLKTQTSMSSDGRQIIRVESCSTEDFKKFIKGVMQQDTRPYGAIHKDIFEKGIKN